MPLRKAITGKYVKEILRKHGFTPNPEPYVSPIPIEENHILAVNGREKLNRILGKSCSTDGELLSYMEDNKTEYALKIFESAERIEIPNYIQDAIK